MKLAWTICLVLLASVGTWLAFAVHEQRQPAQAAQSLMVVCHLKCLSLALHSYHDVDKELPPAALCDKDGKPLLSWRVLVLPYVEQGPLFKKFKLDEPWDSSHNLQLLAEMPSCYDPPEGRTAAEPFVTFVQAIVGEGAAFEVNKRLKLRDDFPDGPGSTVLLIQAARAVPWTKPEDASFSPNGPLPQLGKFLGNRSYVAMADASIFTITTPIDDNKFRAIITRNRKEKLAGLDWIK